MSASSRTAARSDHWPDSLGRALTGAGVTTHVQPIVDLGEGVVVGYEALTRFKGYPVDNPESWFQAAARSRHGPALEALALRLALAARRRLPEGTWLSVNVGPDVLETAPVQQVLARQRDLRGVVVELTEHARIDSYTTLEPALQRLRSAGATIAIDDAGAGYAGLQHLVTIRPQIIKLDRTLVSGVDRDETKRALVEMIVGFASRIDARVLAEGIEHLNELDTVIGLGVPLAQGYLLGRPGPPWPAIDRRGLALLHHQRPRSSGHSLRAIVEGAATVFRQSDAAAAFVDDHTDLVVTLDAQHHPVATVDADGVVHSALEACMRVDVDTPIREAAERALTRPIRQRFHPLLCVDAAGRFVGVARLERVLTYLTARTALE